MKQTYILAISGGIDSVVLLHKLASVKPDWITYIVAHVNHGIRTDSDDDEQFVSSLAKDNDFTFESINLKLGKDASEELAREKRYDFLFSVLKKYKAEAIITAHHQDDVLETMMVNMLRGTGPRGLVGFQRKQIIRPFLNTPKATLEVYASKHKLAWRNDSTNSDEKYLRNYVRARLMPRLNEHRAEFLSIRQQTIVICSELDTLCKRILVQSLEKKALVRVRFVILPYVVQKELIACWFRMYGISFDKILIEHAVLAIKTLKAGKIFQLNSKTTLIMTKNTIILNVSNHAV